MLPIPLRKVVKLHPSGDRTTAIFHGFCLSEMKKQFVHSRCSLQSPVSAQLLKCTAIHTKSHVSKNAKLYFRKHLTNHGIEVVF